MAAEAAAGGSARADSDRLAEARLLRDIEMWGGLGGVSLRAAPEPGRERGRKADEGEELAAKRLEKHLRGSDVSVMHDLRIPGTRTKIDHVCIGQGGVTVIESKSYKGNGEVRRGQLWINGRPQIRLINGLRSQVDVVRMVLVEGQVHWVEVEGALSITNLDGAALSGGRRVDEILIDDPEGVAAFAGREGDGSEVDVDLVRAVIGARLAHSQSER